MGSQVDVLTRNEYVSDELELSGTQPSHGPSSQSVMNGPQSLDPSVPTAVTSLADEGENCLIDRLSVWEDFANSGNYMEAKNTYSTSNGNDVQTSAGLRQEVPLMPREKENSKYFRNDQNFGRTCKGFSSMSGRTCCMGHFGESFYGQPTACYYARGPIFHHCYSTCPARDFHYRPSSTISKNHYDYSQCPVIYGNTGIFEFQRDEKRCGGGCRINQPPSVPTNANAPTRIKDEESMHTAQSAPHNELKHINHRDGPKSSATNPKWRNKMQSRPKCTCKKVSESSNKMCRAKSSNVHVRKFYMPGKMSSSIPHRQHRGRHAHVRIIAGPKYYEPLPNSANYHRCSRYEGASRVPMYHCLRNNCGNHSDGRCPNHCYKYY